MCDETEVVAAVVAALRDTREKRGVSQYRLAKETGLSPSGIRHMENGRVNPTLYFLLRICGFFEIDLADLISQAVQNPHPPAHQAPKRKTAPRKSRKTRPL